LGMCSWYFNLFILFSQQIFSLLSVCCVLRWIM
jgi:hypothetical protein